MSKKHKYPVFQILSGGGGADVSVVTATAPDVDEGKVFVDSTGSPVTGTSTYKADYIALSDNIDDLNEDLEEVITGDGTGGGLTVDSVKGLIDGTATTFTIPEGMTSIHDYAFAFFSYLTDISIPNTVTSIRDYAFYYATRLELTELPISVTTIGNSTFCNCSKLALTSLPSGLINLGTYVFKNCKLITISEIPSGVREVGSQAFYGCTGLTEMTFKAKPQYGIKTDSFQGCTNLTTIRVPWQEGEVANAPWGAVNSSIIYGYTPA
jgi:hypothetical protein